MSWLRERRVALAAITLFTLLAGDFWRYSITWFGWGAIILALAVAWAAVAVRSRMPWRGTPIALVAFGALCVVSTVWSNYPLVTALGALTTVLTISGGIIMARTLDLAQVLRALGVALRWVIGLSLVFELVVAAVVRAPVLPLWVSYEGEIPRAYYWSRAELFEVLDGGRIQGIVGNANLLGFAALLAVIVFSVQLVDRRVGQAAGWGWIASAVLAFACAGSSTMIVAALVVAVVLGLVLLARRLGPSGQRRLLAGSLIGGIGAVAAAILARDALLGLLGRSGDLTNRVDIWAAVTELIGERPVLGWGWVSYWAPWVEPFDGLVVIGGVQYLQAHNAWLDVTLQLGILGLAVFATLVVTTAARTVTWAVDAPLGDEPASAAARLLPVLVLALLLVQSLAESRLLLEAGLLLLSWIAVASRSSGRVLAGVGR
ncbi:O-antigen ligase family protein [Microcella daejeonensis]|uniref:O-antigen ligase family protein n=1 Tax=Microcella daejeonensis TaxID=2994971 RepID=UPI00226DB23A|nr:O-antigen ligase family protein [Microcella daejeonensis]WAB84030.1 O-antigen ligase family protein [Microcella daejeonensis]